MTKSLDSLNALRTGFSLADAVAQRRIEQEKIDFLRQKEQQEMQRQAALQQLSVEAFNNPEALKRVTAQDRLLGQTIAAERDKFNQRSYIAINDVLSAKPQDRPQNWARSKSFLERQGIDTSDLPAEYSPEVENRLRQKQVELKTWNDTFKTLETSQGIKLISSETGEIKDTGLGANQSANRPAVLQIADELYRTSDGKITRQNAILMAGKFLNKENVVNPETGDVEKLGGSLVATKQTKEAESAGKKTGELETEKLFNAPKAQSSMEAAFAKNDNVVKLIDETVPKVTPLTAGFGGTVLSKVPGSDARDLQKQVKSIVANLGFDELQEMRANSPTGGALGQIAVQEIQYLQAVKANLEQDQSPAQLRKNLESAKKQILASKNRVKAAYEREYKGQSKEESNVINWEDL